MVFEWREPVLVPVHQEQVSAKVSVLYILSEIIWIVLRDGIQVPSNSISTSAPGTVMCQCHYIINCDYLYSVKRRHPNIENQC